MNSSEVDILRVEDNQDDAELFVGNGISPPAGN
jgi:hypothetical protein